MQLFANNVTVFITNPISSASLSIVVDDASKLPVPTGSDYFLLTFFQIDNHGVESNWEIVKITAVASNTLTVPSGGRGFDGTTARGWGAGSNGQMRSTRSTLATATANAEVAFNNAASAVATANAAAAQVGALAGAGGDASIGTIAVEAGAVARTQQAINRESISVKAFGALGGGNDDSAAITLAASAAVSSGKKLVFPRDRYKLTTNILTRTDGLLIEGNNSEIILGSSAAGFSIAGVYNHIRDFRFTQSSQSFTPLAINFFNDATTPNTQHNRATNCSGESVYQGIRTYMGNAGAGAAAYRTILTNCIFQNFYLQGTWSGSFGISFDGPNAGNAGGNDSRCVTCLAKGYQKNYLINNSIATQFSHCTGDGGASNFSYEGASSGLQIIGGYYEYNTDFITVVGSAKYDAYVIYPSLANNTNFITGAGINFLSGGLSVGAVSGTFNNGAFINIFDSGASEIYSVNGTKFYSGNTKTLRLTLGNNDDWTFESGRVLLKTGMSMLTDKVQGYTGGGTPLQLNAAQIITFFTGSTEGGRFDVNGNFLVQRVGTGIRVKEGSNAKQGTATLVAGAAVVGNTSVTATSRILLTSNADGGTPGWLRVSARTAGTSFTITSSSGTDTSTVAYEIFEPA